MLDAFKRSKDKVALVGFSPTRISTPWTDDSYEIWSLNEGYNFDWMGRFDRWFQIHPRWDFSRTDNFNDPNHWLWLQNTPGVCGACKGTKEIVNLKKETVDCPACTGTGIYHPKRRENVPIYMQKKHDDIPNSVEYPLNEIYNKFQKELGYKYFTSSFSYMISLAMHMGFKQIDLYGFEMGMQTEYNYQKANAEYWIGLAKGLGFDIRIPKEAKLLKGELYGYKSLRQGYRQQLEFRSKILEQQKQKEVEARLKMEGALSIMGELPDFEGKEDRIAAYNEIYTKKLALINIVKGAQQECLNLTKLYENYFVDGTESGDEQDGNEVNGETQQHVTVQYAAN